MLYVAGVWLVIQAVLVVPVGAQDALPSAGQLEVPSKGGVVLNVQPSASESAKHMTVAVEPDGQGPAVTGAADVMWNAYGVGPAQSIENTLRSMVLDNGISA